VQLLGALARSDVIMHLKSWDDMKEMGDGAAFCDNHTSAEREADRFLASAKSHQGDLWLSRRPTI
jgi:hypothetical protein